MCTVSWQRGGEGYELLFNRDEQRSRPEAEPPTLRRTGKMRWIAPTDPPGGGSWAFVNEAGLTGVVLNLYGGAKGVPGENAGSPVESRGSLLLRGATAGNVREFAWRMESVLRPGACRPGWFLAIAEVNEHPVLLRWNGRECARVSLSLPFFTTSSHRGEEVRRVREGKYLSMVNDPCRPRPEELVRLHDQQDPSDGAASIRMSRSDARTVSQLRIRVTREEVVMGYRPLLKVENPISGEETVVRLTRNADCRRVIFS